jgi:uncharacterized protein YjbI with pentapeptide repeats
MSRITQRIKPTTLNHAKEMGRPSSISTGYNLRTISSVAFGQASRALDRILATRSSMSPSRFATNVTAATMSGPAFATPGEMTAFLSSNLTTIAGGLVFVTASALLTGLHRYRHRIPLIGPRFLANRDLSGANFKNRELTDANLDLAILDGSIFTGARLKRASMNKASLDGAKLTGANLDHVNLKEASLEGATMVLTTFVEADLSLASFDNSVMNLATLSGATLNKTTFQNATLDGVLFDKVTITEAEFQGASLREATFKAAQINGMLINEKTNLDNANFYDAFFLKKTKDRDSHRAAKAEILENNAYLISRIKELGYELVDTSPNENMVRLSFKKM